MTRIVVAMNISRPIETVFNCATTLASCPEWHPASRKVSGAVDHSLLLGEEATEDFVAGGRGGHCVWRVTRREEPFLWTIATTTPQIRAEITYRLTAARDARVFERDMSYSTSGLWLGVLGFRLLRGRMEAEWRAALARLKKRLEQPGP
jgi:uncharacterized protein YndB with AHSA1/START domain